VVGGAFSFVATIITIRNERSQVRQGASYAASSAIADNIMTIDETMDDIQWAMDPRNNAPDPNIDDLLKTLHAAARRILYMGTPAASITS
jgi:hypothetical protein